MPNPAAVHGPRVFAAGAGEPWKAGPVRRPLGVKPGSGRAGISVPNPTANLAGNRSVNVTLQQTTRGRHRADVRPITFLSDIRSSKVVRNSTVGVATAGLAFRLAAPAATAADYGPDPSASTQGASDSQGASNANTATHTVSSGDTVAKIAAEYGASTRAVIEANGLGADALIFPGDELTIPGASGSSST